MTPLAAFEGAVRRALDVHDPEPPLTAENMAPVIADVAAELGLAPEDITVVPDGEDAIRLVFVPPTVD